MQRNGGGSFVCAVQRNAYQRARYREDFTVWAKRQIRSRRRAKGA